MANRTRIRIAPSGFPLAIAGRLCFLLSFCLLFAPNRCLAGSIFDDNYVPPTRETPKSNAQPAPADTAPAPVIPPPQGQPAPAPAPAVNTARRLVPKPPEQAQCRKLFKEAFADQLKDKTATGRKKLARLLLDEAAKNTAAPVDCFVLLSGALQSAEEAGSLKLSTDAIDTMSKSYVIDGLGAESDAAIKIWSNATATTATLGNAQNAFNIIDSLTAEDDFATAAKVASALQHGISKISDADLKSAATSYIHDFEAARIERARIAPDLEKLKTAPDDPAANYAVGSFWCLTRGQWEKGLPFLARGNNAVMKDLAAADIGKTQDAETVGKLADRWWDASARLAGNAKIKSQLHAADLYRGIIASFNGIQRISVEKRIATAQSLVQPRRIDLLDTVDLDKDVAGGRWRFEDGVLSCENPDGYCVIGFDYTPPEEYDFMISYTVVKGDDTVGQVCSGAGHQFIWVVGGWGNRICTFDNITGAPGDNNATTSRSPGWLMTGQRYTSLVRIRKSGMEGLLNNKPITKWKTDYSDMSLSTQYHPHNDNPLGIGTHNRAIKIDRVVVVEIKGQGTITK